MAAPRSARCCRTGSTPGSSSGRPAMFDQTWKPARPSSSRQRSASAVVLPGSPKPRLAQPANRPGWAAMVTASSSLIRAAQPSASAPPSTCGPGRPWLSTARSIPDASMSASLVATSRIGAEYQLAETDVDDKDERAASIMEKLVAVLGIGGFATAYSMLPPRWIDDD